MKLQYIYNHLVVNLMNKLNTFENKTKTKKQLLVALITTTGLKKNVWSEDLIDQVTVLEDLFKHNATNLI